jgi:hypothetical protein
MKYCKNCKYNKSKRMTYIDYEMSTQTPIPNCYLEKYIEKLDESICLNYKRKWWRFW